MSEATPLDVVVPVYFAHAEFRRCVASLLRHTDLARHRVIVVLDGPGQDEARAAVQLSPAAESFLVLENARRGGFVVSANRGMAASERDVILLNSDTEVTAGWVEKMQAAADSDPAVATVTPFSNNATLVSLPRPFEANALPSGFDTDSFGRLVASVSRRAYPRLPTAVGVCMLIRRAVLRAIGPFDEERFGLGYGEENDFCMRASRAGFVHVLDDATFVYHAGQRSFGASRPRLARAAMRSLTEVHPEYLPRIAAFMKADPLREARQRVTDALRPKRTPVADGVPRRIVHLVHGWPPWDRAGTETYARGLAVRQAASRDVGVYARVADAVRLRGEATELVDHGARVRLVVNNFTQRDPLSRNAIRDTRLAKDFARFLDEQAPELVHVHHLAGHSASLADVLRARRIPYVYQLQDWWSLCARTNLLDAWRRACPGPAPARCARCLPLTGLAPSALWTNLLYRRRASVLRAALSGAAAVVMGSEAIRRSFRELGWLGPDAGRVIPYGVEPYPPAAPRPPAARPLRFATIGSVMPHKGVHVALAAFRAIAPEAATLDVWGDDHLLPEYAGELRALASPAVRFRGTFAESAREDVFAGMDVLIAPSLGLESFGLAVAEAQARGVPVVASRRGALVERVTDGVDGARLRSRRSRRPRGRGRAPRRGPRDRRRLAARAAGGRDDGRARARDRRGVRRGAGASLIGAVHTARTALRVLRGEGARAVVDRALDRLDEWRDARRPAAAAPGALGRADVLDVLPMPAVARLGGVALQLRDRLRHESRQRASVLLSPDRAGFRLEHRAGDARRALAWPAARIGGPALEDRAFEDAVARGLAESGARVLHFEGVAGVPPSSAVRASGAAARLVVSVHDFAPFCPRPHLWEATAARFCAFSTDEGRCHACLARDFELPRGFEGTWRTAMAALLQRADALVFPSEELQGAWRALLPSSTRRGST